MSLIFETNATTVVHIHSLNLIFQNYDDQNSECPHNSSYVLLLLFYLNFNNLLKLQGCLLRII
jgi:hypothetical protein